MVDLARQIVCTALGNVTYMLFMIFCLYLHLQDILVSWSQPWSNYRKYPLWNPSVSMQSSGVVITSSVVSRSDKYFLSAFYLCINTFFPQIKPLFCSKISFGGHFVSGPISPSPPTKDFPRFFEGCYDVFLLKIQVWFLSPFFVPWPITYIKGCMLSGILFFLII